MIDLLAGVVVARRQAGDRFRQAAEIPAEQDPPIGLLGFEARV